jgi:hypothetical protein
VSAKLRFAEKVATLEKEARASAQNTKFEDLTFGQISQLYLSRLRGGGYGKLDEKTIVSGKER